MEGRGKIGQWWESGEGSYGDKGDQMLPQASGWAHEGRQGLRANA